MTKFNTRFAPSPNGYLHLGHAFSALISEKIAYKSSGKFFLRIEDIDIGRCNKEFEKNIYEDLSWLGINYQKDVRRQSDYFKNYEVYIKKLRDLDLIYPCWATRSEISKSNDTVLRLKTPNSGEVVVNDLIRGDIVFENSELDDLILLRSDGTPTYHLCNVIDDYEQEVTTVIRGEDHISNTPRQIHIQQALGYPPLEYAHLPMVLGQDKKRLSKRHAATSLDEYQSEGYLDVSIINTLARLGWSGGKNEVFNLEELIRDFDIKEVQKAGAIFDLSKLDWINSQHLSQLDEAAFKAELMPFIDNLNLDYSDYDQLDDLIEAMRSVKSNLSLIAEALIPYLDSFKEYDEKGVNKFLVGSEVTLTHVILMLESLDDWNEAIIDEHLAKLQEELELPTPKMNQPIRIALTGSKFGPGIYEING